MLNLPPTDTLLSHIRQQIAVGLTASLDVTPALPPLDWALTHRRIDERPFTLDQHKPLTQIYEDISPHIVVMKPAQVGVSEWAISRAAHALDCGAQFYETRKAGLNVAYLFPTHSALEDFSKERLSGLQQESDHLAKLFTNFDNTMFKQARQSYLYLRSAWHEASLLSFPADLLIMDEFDRMTNKAIALAQKRLRASVLKFEIDISTPTLPGHGIHNLYLQSDQHEWEVPCECGAWITLDFFRDVRIDGQGWDVWQHWQPTRLQQCNVTLACPICQQPIDRFGDGRWIARAPGAILRGYHVPALCFPTIKLEALVLNAVNPDPGQQEEFFRSDLGLPYEAAGSSITESMIHQMATPLPQGVLWRQTVMGIDVGKVFHYRINSTAPSGERWLRTVGVAHNWDELSGLMKRYQVQRCVIDAAPELHGAQTWAAAHPGKVYRAYYNNHLKEIARANDQDNTVQIQRTTAMDAVYAQIVNLKERWDDESTRDPEFIAHLKAPIRVSTIKDDGQEQVTWAHTLPDHYYHSSVYAFVAGLIGPKTRASALVQGVASGWGVTR